MDQDDATRDSALSSERLTNGNGSSEIGTTNGSEPGTRYASEDESHNNVLKIKGTKLKKYLKAFIHRLKQF